MDRSYSSPIGSQNARPVLVIRTCKHIKDNGVLCQAAAQKGSAYCCAHLQLQARTRKMARAGRAASRNTLPIVNDMQAIQVARVRVQVALEAGHIDEGRARLLRWSLRMMATNFRHMEKLAEQQASLASKAPLPRQPS
jgi:hypothetical protein